MRASPAGPARWIELLHAENRAQYEVFATSHQFCAIFRQFDLDRLLHCVATAMRASCRRRRHESGFTLIELLVALSLLTVIAAGIAQLFVVTVRDARAARDQTMAVMLATQKMEQLRALTWRVDGAGVAVSDSTTDLSRSPPDGGGSGLGPSPAATLDVNTAGFVDFLDGKGRWVGTGSAPPPAATFIRRWSIEPLPSDPGNSLLLRVLVTTRIRDAGTVAAGQTRLRRSDEALLVTIRTRKAE